MLEWYGCGVFQNYCLYRDVEEVSIKILHQLGVVKFLVKGLIGFVPKGVGMIINLEGRYRKFKNINFRVMGA